VKVGIVLDRWKLPIFKKVLDENNYKYKKTDGPFDCVTLSVTTSDIKLLTPVIIHMNKLADKSRRTT